MRCVKKGAHTLQSQSITIVSEEGVGPSAVIYQVGRSDQSDPPQIKLVQSWRKMIKQNTASFNHS